MGQQGPWRKRFDLAASYVYHRFNPSTAPDLFLFPLVKAQVVNNGLSEDELLDNIVTFVVAGHETTSGTVNYTLHELSKNQDIQSRLRRELYQFRKDNNGREPTFDEYASGTALPYLDAVMKEGSAFRSSKRDDSLMIALLQLSECIQQHRTPKGLLPGTTSSLSATLSLLPMARSSTNSAFRRDRSSPSLLWLSTVSTRAGMAMARPSDLNAGSLRMRMSSQTSPTLLLPVGMEALLSALVHEDVLAIDLVSEAYLDVNKLSLTQFTLLAMYEYKIILASLIRRFNFHDSNTKVEFKWVGSLQPRIVGQEDKGVQLPIRMSFVDEDDL